MNLMALLNDFFDVCPEMKRYFDMACNSNKIYTSDDDSVIWAGGFMPCVAAMLEDQDTLKDPEGIKRILVLVFSLFEKMALDGAETRDFLKHLTMGLFYDEPELFETAKQYMGRETMKVFEEYCVFLKEADLWQLSQLYSDEELETMTE